MMRDCPRRQLLPLTVLFAAMLLPFASFGFTVDVLSVSGKVGYGKGQKGPWAELTTDVKLEQGMFVRTGPDAKAVLQFEEQAAVTIQERSQIYLKAFEQQQEQPKSLVLLLFGKLWAKVKKVTDDEDEFVIGTPAAIAAVRGTEFFVESDPQTRNARIGVWEGEVGVYAQNDELRGNGVGVKAGFVIEVLYNQPPAADKLLQMEAARQREKQQFDQQMNELFRGASAPGWAQEDEARTAQARDDIRNMNQTQRAKEKAEEDFDKLERALGLLYADTEFVPGGGKRKTSDKSKTLLCLIENNDGDGNEIPGWDGPYLDSDLKDPWGETYGAYQRKVGPRVAGIMLHSNGPDRGRGNNDDFETYLSVNKLKKAAE